MGATNPIARPRRRADRSHTRAHSSLPSQRRGSDEAWAGARPGCASGTAARAPQHGATRHDQNCASVAGSAKCLQRSTRAVQTPPQRVVAKAQAGARRVRERKDSSALLPGRDRVPREAPVRSPTEAIARRAKPSSNGGIVAQPGRCSRARRAPARLLASHCDTPTRRGRTSARRRGCRTNKRRCSDPTTRSSGRRNRPRGSRSERLASADATDSPWPRVGRLYAGHKQNPVRQICATASVERNHPAAATVAAQITRMEQSSDLGAGYRLACEGPLWSGGSPKACAPGASYAASSCLFGGYRDGVRYPSFSPSAAIALSHITEPTGRLTRMRAS